MSNNTILTVLVGSRAHGLETPSSDWDKRGVFIQPTVELLKLGGVRDEKRYLVTEDGETRDDVFFEVHKVLVMAVKSNPSILETFLSPVISATEEGVTLRSLFPYVWSSRYVRDAFIGYSISQHKLFREKRSGKAAAAYLRTLYNGWELLNTGTFTVRITDTEVGEKVLQFKTGLFDEAEVMESCGKWTKLLEEAYENNPNKQVDIDPINKYLLDIRKRFWEVKD